MISFFVPGEPRGKQRARVTRRGTYTPKETVAAERAIGWACKQAMAGRKPLEGPIELSVYAHFTPPASWSEKKRRSAKWKVSKPDLDNLIKVVKDALNKIAWADDAQVARVKAQKSYTGTPGLLIEVEDLE
jgi:Holliday junction resolvase RusA-like endonuclease